ncbi:hypothetical protein [Chryseobacterium sp. c4a]|uniref:hypothetical protein n=1 Tax=Chryseobacterium sp. c4a TaxID=1573582 RepID=UPI001357F2A7|nr:hypothetical protein [Chryseobacterium sp. c4a]
MKKLLYSFLILSSATLFAQKKLAVANNTIGTEDLFKSKGSLMQVVRTYSNSASLPANLKKYSSVFTNGITEYKFTKGSGLLDVITLAVLNEQNGIPSNNPVFIDDHEFADSSTKIYSGMVAKTEIKNNNGKSAFYIYTTK